VLQILGVGASYPTSGFTISELIGLGVIEPASVPNWLKQDDYRNSVLSHEYLKTNSNKEPRELWKLENRPIETPTTLGAQASLSAIQNAGLEVAQIGLVLGDSVTPLETTPGESHRIAGRLELECPAYDISAGSHSFFCMLKSLSSWKKEKIPEDVLCVSANCPTWFTDYSSGMARFLVGDSAAACVISLRHPGRWSLLSLEATHKNPIQTMSHVFKSISLPTEPFLGKKDICLKTNYNNSYVIATVLPEMQLMMNNTAVEYYSPLASRGYSFASSSLAAFAEREKQIKQDRVVLIDSDLEQSLAEIVLQIN